METSRIAGQMLVIAVSRFEMTMARQADEIKRHTLMNLAHQIERQFPPCANCKNLKLEEQQDYARDATQYGVRCGKFQRDGDVATCPDGFMGKLDLSGKQLKEIKPMTPINSAANVDWSKVDAAYKNDLLTRDSEEFRKMYLNDYSTYSTAAATNPGKTFISIEDIQRATREIEAMRPGLSSGESKIAHGLNSLLRPPVTANGNHIPTDRSAYPPPKPRDRDVPQTAEGDAW